MEIAPQAGICVRRTFVLMIMAERIQLFRDHLITGPASDKKNTSDEVFFAIKLSI